MPKRVPLNRGMVRGIQDTRLQDLVKEALALGWTGEKLGSGHLRLVCPPGTGDERLFVSTTSVDYRGVRNCERPLRRWKQRQ